MVVQAPFHLFHPCRIMGKTNRNSGKYCFNHTKERMYERHQLGLTEGDYKVLCDRFISAQKRKLTPALELPIIIINREKNQYIFETEYKGKKLRFVWSDKRKTITTVF